MERFQISTSPAEIFERRNVFQSRFYSFTEGFWKLYIGTILKKILKEKKLFELILKTFMYVR